jgi:spermidine synthase
MKPWIELGRAPIPGGGVLTLCQRDTEYVIRVDNRELMTSRTHDSEEALARKTCAELADKPNVSVLIGGLGMGYTLRAALDLLGKDAVVHVAELVPEVVVWNKGPLGALAGHPMSDPRVRIDERDVAMIMDDSPGAFDAILMDVDNGPSEFTASSNAGLHTKKGLARAGRALKKGGVYALWSAGDEWGFTSKLERAGFDVRVEKAPARGSSGRGHVLWFARVK